MMKIMMLILTVNIAITFIFNIYTSIISAYEKRDKEREKKLQQLKTGGRK